MDTNQNLRDMGAPHAGHFVSTHGMPGRCKAVFPHAGQIQVDPEAVMFLFLCPVLPDTFSGPEIRFGSKDSGR
ncbi:MAG: hypothetical protein ACQES5_02660 [Thermodesulfobacteriota bacterium]